MGDISVLHLHLLLIVLIWPQYIEGSSLSFDLATIYYRYLLECKLEKLYIIASKSYSPLQVVLIESNSFVFPNAFGTINIKHQFYVDLLR